jgi:hypothetical protein
MTTESTATQEPRCVKCGHLQSRNVSDRCAIWTCCCPCTFPAAPETLPEPHQEAVQQPESAPVAANLTKQFMLETFGDPLESDDKDSRMEKYGVAFAAIQYALAATPSPTAEAEGGRTRRDPQFQLDAWPLPDVLSQLALWAEHLSHVHNCDCHGWEAIGFLITAARDYATVPTAEYEAVAREIVYGDLGFNVTEGRRIVDAFAIALSTATRGADPAVEAERLAITDWLAHRCEYGPPCGRCTYCQARLWVEGCTATRSEDGALRDQKEDGP